MLRVIDWQPVKGVPWPHPSVYWDQLQPPVTLNRGAVQLMDGWMSECRLDFIVKVAKYRVS